MSGFPTPLRLEAKSPEELRSIGSDRQLYVLESEFRYDSDAFGPIVVPAGYVTDFASIPRAALWYVNDDSPAILFASVVHDYLYTLKGALPRLAQPLSRGSCDSILREAMLACGARPAQAWVVYRAVQAFGGGHWK